MNLSWGNYCGNVEVFGYFNIGGLLIAFYSDLIFVCWKSSTSCFWINPLLPDPCIPELTRSIPNFWALNLAAGLANIH